MLQPGVLEGSKLPYELEVKFQFIIMSIVYNNSSNYIRKHSNVLQCNMVTFAELWLLSDSGNKLVVVGQGSEAFLKIMYTI